MEQHRGGFCIKSVKSKTMNVDIPKVENFDFAQALASVYPLLELVFQYLPYEDLKECLSVHPSWKESAEKIISKRISPSWVTCYELKKPKANVIYHSSNLNFNNVSLGIILYDTTRIKLNKYICLHKNTTELFRKTVPEYLEEELIPNSVDYCLLSVPRVVSQFDPDNTSIDNVTYGSIFDGVFIPKIPNIRTTMFHCNPGKREQISETINMFIKPNEEVKCLLVFCKTNLQESLRDLLNHLAPKKNPRSMAFGGGVIRGTRTFQQLNPQKKIFLLKDTVCIAFLKEIDVESNFRGYSYVIKGNDLSQEEFDSELMEFRKRVALKKYSLGFRICCSAKFDRDSELTSFRKAFHKVPLLGLDAYGEIGWNCLETVDGEETTNEDTMTSKKAKRAKKRSTYPEYQHFWSSIFVIITWE